MLDSANYYWAQERIRFRTMIRRARITLLRTKVLWNIVIMHRSNIVVEVVWLHQDKSNLLSCAAFDSKQQLYRHRSCFYQLASLFSGS